MKRDIRSGGTFRAVEAFLEKAYSPGCGKPYDLVDLSVSADGKTVAASGLLLEKLEGVPDQRIFLIDLEDGSLRAVTHGPHRDRLPRWDPTGERIAYLSDATAPYDFQLTILTLASGEIIRLPLQDRWVENLQWSADGRQILLLAAGKGADLPGAQGGVTSSGVPAEGPDWAPHVDEGHAEAHWRTLWVYDVALGTCRQVSPPGVNPWEACWCGPGHIACIASNEPLEEAWYTADVRLIDLASGTVSTIYTPHDQLGWISASPSGARIAFVEAYCSDRLLVAGTLMSGNRQSFAPVDTHLTDVTFTTWQDETALLFAGIRGFETVLGLYQPLTVTTEEIWSSETRTFGGALYPDAAPAPVAGSALFMAEGHLLPPALVLASRNEEERIFPVLDMLPADASCPGARLENAEWCAPDGLTIQGWLLRPAGAGPHPLLMDVHGGPVWRSRPRYVGRGGYAGMLLRAGYAVFQPNPRGSSGQGQAFARKVMGDAGGGDARDLLAGLDYLVDRGVARADRIGIVGGSYGGYMTAWLVTQDQRFAAAVAIAPVADWISLRLTSHVPASIETMLGSSAEDGAAKYLARSPVTHAERARTPTLIITGELDRSTPASQGLELHNALQRSAARSVLLTYPGEGHGVRQFPAILDFISRIVDWFGEHMPPNE